MTLKNYVGTGTFTLKGNTTTPANTAISATNTHAVYKASGTKDWTVADLTLQTTTSGHGMLVAGSALLFSNLRFGSIAGNQISVNRAGSAVATGNYAIVGGAQTHVWTESGAIAFLNNRTVTLTGTPAFSLAFAGAEECGSVTIDNNTFSGSATGPRYLARINGVINTNGGGANYLPGNSAGSTATGGQYV